MIFLKVMEEKIII